MRVKEISNVGNTSHLYKSELAAMCSIKNVPDKAREEFKRKPYDVKKKVNK